MRGAVPRQPTSAPHSETGGGGSGLKRVGLVVWWVFRFWGLVLVSDVCLVLVGLLTFWVGILLFNVMFDDFCLVLVGLLTLWFYFGGHFVI